MKPTYQLTEDSRRRNSRVAKCTADRLPKTDYAFRANSIADFNGRCHGSPAPSFRRISDDYFEHEASRHFVSEAAMFGLMLIAAAVPVFEGARGAINFVRAIALL